MNLRSFASLAAAPLAALAMLCGCSNPFDSGDSRTRGEAEVIDVTPVYRHVEVAPALPGCDSQAQGSTAPAQQPSGCTAADARPAIQRQPAGYEVAYRYRGETYHTHTDYRPGAYMRVELQLPAGS
jgi:hypothetical protein